MATPQMHPASMIISGGASLYLQPHRRPFLSHSVVSLSPLRFTKIASAGGGGGYSGNNGGSGGGDDGKSPKPVRPDGWTLFKQGLKEGLAEPSSGSFFPDTYEQVIILLLAALGWFVEKKTGWIKRWMGFSVEEDEPSASGSSFAKINSE